MKVNILDFGAVAGGVVLNTEAIQKAIDEVSNAGGGKVVVPSGLFKSGTIWLKSNVELHLEAGAELLASDNMDDYNELDAFSQNYGSKNEKWVGKHFIIALEAENCSITGFGKINGNLHSFVTKKDTPKEIIYCWCNGVIQLRDEEKQRPGQLVCFIECKHVKVCDITIVDSPCWSCYLLGCEYAQIRGIKVMNPIWMVNADGIDIDACRFVTVSDCIINTADDAITLRACEGYLKNKDMHCEYVTITNCVLSTGICAFRIGVGRGHIKHVRISNIVVRHCMDIIQLCTAYSPTCCVNIEDVNFSNISAENTDRCFDIFAKNGASIKDITIENIRTSSAIVSKIEREDGSIDNVTVRNVELKFADKVEEYPEIALRTRGDNLLLVDGASNVTFDKVKIMGGLRDVTKIFEAKNSENLVRENCNF